MTVKLDSGKIAEVSSQKTRHIDCGYAVDGLRNSRAERVIVRYCFNPKLVSLVAPHAGSRGLKRTSLELALGESPHR